MRIEFIYLVISREILEQGYPCLTNNSSLVETFHKGIADFDEIISSISSNSLNSLIYSRRIVK